MTRPDWDELELAWAAGYFDGEGSIGCYGGKGSGNNKSLALSVGNTQLEELERFKAAVGGVGTINGPYSKNKRKPFYSYRVQNVEGVKFVVSCIWNYLSSNKRNDIETAYSDYETYKNRPQKECSIHIGVEKVLINGRETCKQCLVSRLPTK